MFDISIYDCLKKGLLDCCGNDEIPVAAVIIDSSNRIVSVGINNRQSDCNVLGHAEINAIVEAEKVIGDWRLDGYRMIVTLAPCSMCRSVIDECRLDKVFYLCHRDNVVIDNEKYEFLCTEYLSEDYIKKLLTTFFNNRR